MPDEYFDFSIERLKADFKNLLLNFEALKTQFDLLEKQTKLQYTSIKEIQELIESFERGESK